MSVQAANPVMSHTDEKEAREKKMLILISIAAAVVLLIAGFFVIRAFTKQPRQNNAGTGKSTSERFVEGFKDKIPDQYAGVLEEGIDYQK